MVTNLRRLFTIAFALLLFAAIAAPASACCGQTAGYYPQAYAASYAPAYTAGYAPAYTSYYGGSYAPAYTSYYGGSYASNYNPGYTSYYGGGWYPGYWMDRVRTRLWGSPATYVTAGYPASYASSYTAAYPATYAASYTAAYPASYATSYAPSYASYAPSCCTTCASPCCDTGCSSCGTVTQASYAPQQQCCGTSTQQPMAPQAQPNTVIAPPGTTVIQQNGAPAATEPPPSLNSAQGAPQSTYRPSENSVLQPQPQQAQPAPTREEYKVKNNDSSTYLESPKLFNPNDRTAKRSIAPVHTAVYKQPVGYRSISAPQARITAEQAQAASANWTSASN